MDTSKKKNRPDMRDLIPKGVMFHETGSTGWGRKKDLGDYKDNRSEHNFADQYDRFFDPAVDTLE
jgi:hypothetical protein